MKKILTLFFLLASTLVLYAQPISMSYIDKILLEDGSSLVGQVIDQTDQEVSFQIIGGPVIKIARNQIKELLRGEEVKDKKGKVYFSNGKSISTKGSYATLHIGTNWTNNETVDGKFGGLFLSSSYGFHFNRFLSVGGGIGIEIINGPNFNNYTFVPVFAEIRGYPFSNKTTTPYYAMSIGYGFGWDLFDSFSRGSYTGGLNVEPRIGLRFASHKRSQFYTELGYKYQSTESTYRRSSFEGATFVKQDIQFFRPTLNFGWLF